jgi:hypothetical protein
MIRYEKIIKGFTTMVNKLEALATKAADEEAAATGLCKTYKARAIAADDERKAALNTANKIKELIGG